MKRAITKRQEQILRLVHHDFDGLSQTEAAVKLGVNQSVISDALKRVEKAFPHFFPILTRLEAERHHLYCVEGWSVEEIAEHFEVTPDSIYKALQRAKGKGACFTEPKGRVLSYSPDMDADVVYKF
ncbi:hypothetical protein LCGC14_0948910 [marine sediment metagenome]|uniref:RNA polymerase sigma factor 70 region 4 type 2 domain-containing protein n=1 Tax=marine sediment metagenome TaxID=412755 RepID=A0A0F9NHZ8_9ZZZZ